LNLEINKIYHQYITRMVIFSLFLNKVHIRTPGVYKQSVHTFLKRRLSWDINLRIDTGKKLDRDSERDLLLDQVLYDFESKYLTEVIVEFTTPIKDVKMEINLSEEDKYEDFLYD